MKWNVGTKIGASFIVALAIFLAVNLLSARSVAGQTEDADWVARTHEILTEVARLTSRLEEAETAQRGYIITGDESYLAPHTAGAAAAQETRRHLAELVAHSPQIAPRVQALEPLIAERFAVMREGIDLRRSRDFAAAQLFMQAGRGKRVMDEIRDIARAITTEEETLLRERRATAQGAMVSTRRTILFGTLLGLAIAGLAGFLIARNIAVPLKRLTSVAERITTGDLSGSAVEQENRTDEVGALARALGRMADNLRRQIGGMVEGAAVLGSASSEIVAAAAQLASSSSESAAAVSETTTTVEEIRQTAQLASQKARMVSDSAQKAVQVSLAGRKSTEEAAAGMNRVRAQMDAIGESMMRLSEQTQAIGQIMASVEDLAAQSNLLAVNAAIEAAKAGEHGKGFGVVAQEVKSLAEQSRQATERVRSILGDVQKAATAAVLVTEQGNKAVEAGNRQTALADESIQNLLGGVTEAAQSATQIAASSQQQLVGMEQVAGAMENIRQASTQNVASARQLEIAARNINELGQRLKQLVANYSV